MLLEWFCRSCFEAPLRYGRWLLATTKGSAMKTETIQIIDCGRGPQLSTTRITVLDVFYYLHRGYDFAAIHRIMPTLTRAEYDVVEEYVNEHRQDLVEADRQAEEFIQQGIAAQKAKGLLPDVDATMPQEERLARLKAKLHEQRANNHG